MKGNGIMACFGFQGKQKPVCFSVSSRHYTLVFRLCGSLFRVVNHSRLFSKILYGFFKFFSFQQPRSWKCIAGGATPDFALALGQQSYRGLLCLTDQKS